MLKIMVYKFVLIFRTKMIQINAEIAIAQNDQQMMSSHCTHNMWVLLHPSGHTSIEVQLVDINKFLRFHFINQDNTSKKN